MVRIALELLLLESESDLSRAGLEEGGQDCVECGLACGISEPDSEVGDFFVPVLVVSDVTSPSGGAEWSLCDECAAPFLDHLLEDVDE